MLFLCPLTICVSRECCYIFIQNPDPQVITLGSRHQAPRLIPTRTDINYAIHLKSRYGHHIRIAGYKNPSRPIPSSLILQPSTSLPNHPPASEISTQMPQLTTQTVLWDEKKPAMEMETPLTTVSMAADSLQAPISPFSLGNSESSPSSSPSPSPRNENKTSQGKGEEKGDSFKPDSIVVKPSNTTATNTTHLAELTELATALARALSYTEGYDLDRGTQTQKVMNNVYELQTLTRCPSVRVAGHHPHRPVGVEDSLCSPRPISRRVRAERRARRYALV